MNIICECGHKVGSHSYLYNQCLADIRGGIQCPCLLSYDAVEARYWARRMMKERDAMEHNLRVFEHRGNALQAKLNDAIEAIKKAKSEMWGMPGRADHILDEALAWLK